MKHRFTLLICCVRALMTGLIQVDAAAHWPSILPVNCGADDAKGEKPVSYPLSDVGFRRTDAKEWPVGLKLLVETSANGLSPGKPTRGAGDFDEKMVVNAWKERFDASLPGDWFDHPDSPGAILQLYGTTLHSMQSGNDRQNWMWGTAQAKSVSLSADRSLAAIAIDLWDGTSIPERIVLRAKVSADGDWKLYDAYIANIGIHLSSLAVRPFQKNFNAKEMSENDTLAFEYARMAVTAGEVRDRIRKMAADSEIQTMWMMRIANHCVFRSKFKAAFEMAKMVADEPGSNREMVFQFAARAAVKAGLWKEAQKYNELYKLHASEDAYYHGTKGAILSHAGDLAGAEKAYGMGLAADPTSLECFLPLVAMDSAFDAEKHREQAKALGRRRGAILEEESAAARRGDAEFSKRLRAVFKASEPQQRNP